MHCDLVIRDGCILDGTGNPWFKADIGIFDEQRIRDRSTFARPTLPPEGVVYVIVNGEIAVDREVPTGVLAGKLLTLDAVRCN